MWHTATNEKERTLPHLAIRARVGRTATQLRKLDRSGVLPARRTLTGPRYDTEADVARFPGTGDAAPQGLAVVYGRVSRRARQEDLCSQVAAMATYGLGAGVAVDAWLTEIGGGLDCQRTVFLALMARIGNRDIAHWLIAHRDRLVRFGCDWFAHFAQRHGCTLTVVNQASLSPPAELVEDLMAIVDTFSGRLHGLRAYQRTIREAACDGR